MTNFRLNSRLGVMAYHMDTSKYTASEVTWCSFFNATVDQLRNNHHHSASLSIIKRSIQPKTINAVTPQNGVYR